MDQKLSVQWARVRARMRAEFGETAYQSWLKPLTLDGLHDGTLRLVVPNRFMQSWVESQYGERLKALWSGENPAIRLVEIDHAATAAGASDRDDFPERAEPLNGTAVDDICAPLDDRFRFDNFIVGKPNELAFAAARRVAEAHTVPFNPLFLFGGVGLGKTHLMHAIA